MLALCGLAGCNRSGKGEDKSCQERCDRQVKAAAALQKDLDGADLAIKELEQIQVTEDAAIKPSGEKAATLCGDVRGAIAHARGIAWALNNSGISLGAVDLDQSLAPIDEKAHLCAGRSPAQIKAALAEPVHAAHLSIPAEVKDLAACNARCSQR